MQCVAQTILFSLEQTEAPSVEREEGSYLFTQEVEQSAQCRNWGTIWSKLFVGDQDRR